MKQKEKSFSLRFRVLNFLSGGLLKKHIKDAMGDVDLLIMALNAASNIAGEEMAEGYKTAVHLAKRRLDVLDKILEDMFYL